MKKSTDIKAIQRRISIMNRVKEILSENNIKTVKEISEFLNLSTSHVYNLQKGVFELDNEYLEKISCTFNVRLQYLKCIDNWKTNADVDKHMLDDYEAIRRYIESRGLEIAPYYFFVLCGLDDLPEDYNKISSHFSNLDDIEMLKAVTQLEKIDSWKAKHGPYSCSWSAKHKRLKRELTFEGSNRLQTIDTLLLYKEEYRELSDEDGTPLYIQLSSLPDGIEISSVEEIKKSMRDKKEYNSRDYEDHIYLLYEVAYKGSFLGLLSADEILNFFNQIDSICDSLIAGLLNHKSVWGFRNDVESWELLPHYNL